MIINAIMLGLSRKEARERFDDIIAFAELEEFVDLKLKNYSSGMHVRLAFATAVQVDADILLIDEVLAVGDAAFQQKCFDEFDRLQQAGRTMLFVTHDMGAVERFCDRAMLLDRGRVVDIGEPASIARRVQPAQLPPIGAERDSGAHDEAVDRRCRVAEVVERVVRVRRRGGHRLGASAGRAVRASGSTSQFLAAVDDPIFAIRSRTSGSCRVRRQHRQRSTSPPGASSAGTTARVALAFENWLAPGRYRLIATVGRAPGSAPTCSTRT